VETVNHVLDFTKLSGSSKRDATRSESAVKFTASVFILFKCALLVTQFFLTIGST